LTKRGTNKILNLIIASVWLANGILCKVLNLVPRHQEIVGTILNNDYSKPLTILIGCSEILMAIWILSRFKPKLNAIVQIGVIAFMNILEFALTPDLLLWGRLNAVFAFLFILLIYFNEFVWNKK
jgi:hypothetical protein